MKAEHPIVAEHPAAIGAYSPVVVSGDLVFTSGQGPADTDGEFRAQGIAAQTEATLVNLRRCLGAAGCSLDDVLSVRVYLQRLDDFGEFDRAYRRFFTEPFPVRTTVQAGLLGILVEIDAVARRS